MGLGSKPPPPPKPSDEGSGFGASGPEGLYDARQEFGLGNKSESCVGIYEACIDRIGRDYGTVGDSTSVKTSWPKGGGTCMMGLSMRVFTVLQ